MNRPESLRDEIATIIQAGKVEGNAASDTADAVMAHINSRINDEMARGDGEPPTEDALRS